MNNVCSILVVCGEEKLLPQNVIDREGTKIHSAVFATKSAVSEFQNGNLGRYQKDSICMASAQLYFLSNLGLTRSGNSRFEVYICDCFLT